MTRSCRGRSRRSKGSIVTRSVPIAWRSPAALTTGPRRRISVSNAVGQSSSVPRSRPIRWVVPATGSGAPGAVQHAGEVRIERVAPGRVVVQVGKLVERRVVALQPQRGGDAAVVLEVLLADPAGQRGRHRALELLGAQNLAHEADDAP